VGVVDVHVPALLLGIAGILLDGRTLRLIRRAPEADRPRGRNRWIVGAAGERRGEGEQQGGADQRLSHFSLSLSTSEIGFFATSAFTLLKSSMAASCALFWISSRS